MPAIRQDINILGMRVNMLRMENALDAMEKWIRQKAYGNYICISNADSAVWCKKNKDFKQAVNNSSLSVPDGISLIMLGRLLGHPLKRRVYGPELMLKFCDIADKRGYANFFYGSTEEVLDKLKKRLVKLFPNLRICGSYSPPFRALSAIEEAEIEETIKKARPDVLWVGLGCPKQEIWMFEHKDKLNLPVMVGVGAAFDFLAGTKRQAPPWIRNHGFEWLFRLSTEPKRLWRRYLGHGALFIYYLCVEFLLNIIRPLKKPSNG